MRQQVSLKTIAEKCKISVSNVSQILNNRPGNYSSEETKQHVRDVARELGYHTNFGYKLMFGQQTRTFAILLSMDHMKSEEHIQSLVLKLITELDCRGYSSYFSSMASDAAQNIEIIRNLMQRGAEHFIFLGSPMGHLELQKIILESGKTLLGTSDDFQRYFLIDILDGAKQIFQFLHQQAGENFRYISYDSDSQDKRFTALSLYFPRLSQKELLRKFWRTYPDSLSNTENFNDVVFHGAYNVMESILAREPEVKAVGCHIDTAALGAAACLIDHGKVIGKDMILTGFNNNFAVRNFPYPISSVDHGWQNYYKNFIDSALSNKPCKIIKPPVVHLRKLPGYRTNNADTQAVPT